MSGACINVAYSMNHRKGGDHDDGRLSGQVHAEWLEATVCHLLDTVGLPVFVSITGFPGWPEVPVRPGYYERDVLWRVFIRPKIHFVTMNDQPGHQQGAAWCIRLGLEAASKFQYDYMIHTAEDVLPEPREIHGMIGALDALGADYVGRKWSDDGYTELNSQFFGCRVQALVGTFDSPAVGGVKCLEKYLGDRLQGKRVSHDAGAYRHTHDPAEFMRWLKEAS